MKRAIMTTRVKTWIFASAVLAIAGIVLAYYGAIRPSLASARELAEGLGSARPEVRQLAMAQLIDARELGAGKYLIERQVRKMLRNAQGMDIRPLLTTLSQCAYDGTGVDVMVRPTDQQLVMEAVARQQRYAREHGYSPLHAYVADDGRLHVVPTITLH